MLGLSNSLSSSVAGSPAMQGSPAPAANTNSYSILLDGTNDKLTQPDNDNLFQTFSGSSVNASMSFYIKMPAGVDVYPLFFKQANYSVSYGFILWYTDSNGDLKIQHVNNFSSPSSVWARGWSTGFSADTWYHVVITTDGSATNRVTKCYVDGTEQTANFGNDSVASSVELEAWTSNQTSTPLAIGLHPYGDAANMYIDQIATWTSVLTQSAVTEIYTNNPNLTSDSGNYRASSSLDRYHKIEENTGTTSVDSSGNSNAPLTLANGAAWSTDKPW